MKVFVALAAFCVLQVIVGQVAKEDHKPAHQKPIIPQAEGHVSSQQAGKPQSNQHANKEEDVAVQNQQVKPVSDNSKIPVEIPPKVQQVVAQVSQQLPQVVAEKVPDQQRVVRSVKNRVNWQSMQVNAKEQPGKCQFLCNELDVTACGYNGICYWEFANQCDLATYNCLNSEKIFEVVDFAKCQDISQPKCYRGDM